MKQLLCLLLLLPNLAFTKTITLEENNTISFNQSFSPMYVAKKQVEAINLCTKNPQSRITLVLNSPGGSVSAGQRFFDTLNALDCPFDTVTIFAASMGYQTVQNLGKRYIIPSGILMSHRAFVRGIGGEIGGELDSIINLLRQNIKELNITAANRAGITLEQYESDIADELWMTASQAVKTNHADEIVLVKCGKSLSGTKVETVTNMFGRFEVEFSQCPLVTAPLRVLRSIGNGDVNKLINMYNNPELFIKPVFNYYNNGRL